MKTDAVNPTYCLTEYPEHVANNILVLSFRDEKFVNSMKLQRIMYILYSEYLKETGELLFPDPWETWSYGAVNVRVHNSLKKLKSEDILRYIRYQDGNPLIIDLNNDNVLSYILHSTWESTKDLDAITLCKILRAENSAWDKAFQSENAYLDIQDIKEDVSYKFLFR